MDLTLAQTTKLVKLLAEQLGENVVKGVLAGDIKVVPQRKFRLRPVEVVVDYTTNYRAQFMSGVESEVFRKTGNTYTLCFSGWQKPDVVDIAEEKVNIVVWLVWRQRLRMSQERHEQLQSEWHDEFVVCPEDGKWWDELGMKPARLEHLLAVATQRRDIVPIGSRVIAMGTKCRGDDPNRSEYPVWVHDKECDLIERQCNCANCWLAQFDDKTYFLMLPDYNPQEKR